jgi:endonuclease YncB( thermonuclease family)
MTRILCLLIALALSVPGQAADVQVTDGDTIVVGGASYRLDGIDAPESDQWCLNAKGETSACGLQAEKALSDLVASRSVTCEDLGPDRTNRTRRIGICTLDGEGESLSVWLVRNGWAFNFEPYAKGRFISAQDEARGNGRGLWAECFVMPGDHRRWRKSEATLLGQCSAIGTKAARDALFPDNPRMPPGCPIKAKFAKRAWVSGHVGIFHQEGCKSYRATTKNQRWFCSEEEAVDAGFRRAYTCPRPKRR